MLRPSHDQCLPDEGCRTRCATRRPAGVIMWSWIVLVLSGVLEAVWATALGKSEGFSRVGSTVLFVLGLLGSMAGLAYAMRDLPVATAYAVWVGIGAVLTVTYAMGTRTASVSVLQLRSEERRVGAACRSRWSPSH